MAARQTDALIEQAKQAKRRNDLSNARSLLSQALKADPRNEEAWLLFADVAEKKDHAVYSLEQVLKLNPVNMEALDRLNALKTPPALPAQDPPPAPRSTPAIPPSSTLDRVAATAPHAALHRETVILEERMHGAMFIVPPLIAIIGLGIGIFISSLPGYGLDTIALIAVIGVMLTALLDLVRTVVRYATNRLTLTNKRIVI